MNTVLPIFDGENNVNRTAGDGCAFCHRNDREL